MVHNKIRLSPLWQFITTAVLAMATAIGLFVFQTIRTHELHYTYLLWNLLLAALPLAFAMRLTYVLRTKLWSAWGPIGWTLLWILFLPNSFYMISDYIHLRDVDRDQILYVVILFTAFIFLAAMLGYCSLYIVHRALRRRLSAISATLSVGLLLLLCGFAVYIGRDLRWNSWDVIINPGGLLFDVSDRMLHPEVYTNMLLVSGGFFLLLSSLYAVIWSGLNVLRPLYTGNHANSHLSHPERHPRFVRSNLPR